MKGKGLSFPFKNFSESGLFNGLQAKKIKNFDCLSARVAGCEQPLPHQTRDGNPSRNRFARSFVAFRSLDHISMWYGFTQDIVQGRAFPRAANADVSKAELVEADMSDADLDLPVEERMARPAPEPQPSVP
jgi:hypothetical protein